MTFQILGIIQGGDIFPVCDPVILPLLTCDCDMNSVSHPVCILINLNSAVNFWYNDPGGFLEMLVSTNGPGPAGPYGPGPLIIWKNILSQMLQDHI